MTINIIDKKMIATNSIIIEPEISYVTASEKCNFLDRHEISSAGTFGTIKSNNANIKVNRIFNISENFVNDIKNSNSNVLNKIEEIKEFESCLRDYYSVKINNDIDLTNYELEDLVQKDIIKEIALNNILSKYYIQKGIQFNTPVKANAFEFGVERIKQEFIIDSLSYQKKNSIKNVYQYYQENIKHNNFYDLNWGFKNFNSINFFNIDETVNSNFLANKTHKNCIIYPNLASSLKQAYQISGNKDFTLSFYINPRRKNKASYHYNPGCIIDIPGVISVYIVSGNNKDKDSLADSFRILTQFSTETYNTLESSASDIDFINTSSQNENLVYLSKDNILNYNNWHNICLTFKRNTTINNSGYEFEFFVDGTLIDSLFYSTNISEQQFNSYIAIGNKIENTQNDLNDFVLKTFSKDSLDLNDNLGSYVNKHIKYDNQIDYVLNGASDPNILYEFKNTLNADNSNYILEATSLALNAEIHDIRIYGQSFSQSQIKDITLKGIQSISDEISDNNLIFFVPCYYKSQKIKKKGLINLSAPYKKTISGVDTSITVDDYLEGNYSIFNYLTEDDFKIKTSHISYNFPVNPFFLNYTGGTEVSVESFLQEFVLKTQPNIVFGGNINDDSYQNAFLSKSSYVLNNKHFNKIIKSGGTPNDLIDLILSSLSEEDITNLDIEYQFDNILYKNYMILPNDNGIQQQFYENIFSYSDEDYIDSHKNDLGEIDYSYVSMSNMEENFFIKTQISKDSLITQEYINDNMIVDKDFKENFYIENESLLAYITDEEKVFKEFTDKLRNISLNNYHNDKNISFLDINDYEDVCVWRNNNIDIAKSINIFNKNSFYKTYSNPATRSYYSSYDDSISNVVYDYKSLGENSTIAYKKMYLPLWQLNKNIKENSSTFLCISKQLFNRSVKRESVIIKDVDLASSSGLQLSFSDSKLGTLFRNDCLTKSATWNTSGSILYKEGIVSLMHPSLYNFGKTNFSIHAKSYYLLNSFELNIPSHKNETNLTKNSSYDEDLRLDSSSFNADENFVYITDICFHDENLNVVATAKLAQPFAKKSSDNVLFRLKMDY